MAPFILKRILAAVPVLFIVSLLAFGLIHMAHGDPAVAMFGSQLEKMRPEDQVRIRENLGLNEPVAVQYVKWLSGVLQGELGRSYLDGRPVGQVVADRLPNTLLLSGLALIVMLALAAFLGVAAAIRQYSWIDYLVTGFAFVFYSVPSFWLAMVAILLFAVALGWFPSSGLTTLGGGGGVADRLHHLVLPVLVLAVSHVGAYIRFVRSSMLEVLNQEYIAAAHAKGLRLPRVYYFHALRNAMLPVITFTGLSFSSLIGGSYLVETIFAYPGMGQLTITAAATRDYPLLMGTVLLTGLFVVAGNLLADICCAWADPRLAGRQEETGHG